MLPFLKRTQEGSVSIPVESEKREPDQEQEFDGMQSCMQELIDAIHSKDASLAAEAFKAAFELCESEPHEENENG